MRDLANCMHLKELAKLPEDIPVTVRLSSSGGGEESGLEIFKKDPSAPTTASSCDSRMRAATFLDGTGRSRTNHARVKSTRIVSRKLLAGQSTRQGTSSRSS